MKDNLTYLVNSLKDKAMVAWEANRDHKNYMLLYSMACDVCEEWAYIKGRLEATKIILEE